VITSVVCHYSGRGADKKFDDGFFGVKVMEDSKKMNSKNKSVKNTRRSERKSLCEIVVAEEESCESSDASVNHQIKETGDKSLVEKSNTDLPRPKILPNPNSCLITSKCNPKKTRYGTIKYATDRGSSCNEDTSGDNDSCWSASGSDEVSSSGSSGITSRMSRRQIVVFIMILLNSFSCALTVGMFPPFYPRLAEMKGASATEYGTIIGTSCLVAFLVTPFIGKQLPNIGVKFSFCYGTFAAGICCVLSGLLEFIEPGKPFLIFSVLIRIFHALFNCLVITSTFAYQAMEFPNAVAKVFSFSRCVMNVTQMVGPALGGILLQTGGFYFPFVIMGIGQILLAIASIFIMPPPYYREEDCDRSIKKSKLSICKMLSIPTIWFSFSAFIIATMCNGFISVNLEPEVLRRFSLSPFYIGILFGLKDGANSFASPVWGYLCDYSKKSVKPYLVASSILAALSFLLLGGGELLGIVIQLSLTSLIVALCVNGVGIGGQQVVGIVDTLHEASEAGFPDDPATQGLVAGMWSSLSGAGRFTSRAVSGLLVDNYGFNTVTFIACVLQVVVGLVTFFYIAMCECSLASRHQGLRWEDVTIVEQGRRRDDKVVFTSSSSPSESLMSHAVSVGIPARRRPRVMPRSANSMPPYRDWSYTQPELSKSVK